MLDCVALPVGTGDPVLFDLIDREIDQQDRVLNLVAAANVLSPAVRQAMNPALANVHCEGYPGRRYHQGQTVADAIETLAQDRARSLFGADHANVQPYRGTMANLAASLAVLEPGDTLLGFDCRSGGHYSVGTSGHLIGRLFNLVPYTVDPETWRLDYGAIEALAQTVRPKAMVCGDTAYPRRWDFARLGRIAEAVGAVLIADISQIAGLVAGGAIDSPIPHADIVTLATYKTLRGPRAGLILCRAAHARAVDRAVSPLCQGGPDLMQLAGIAAALGEAKSPTFRAYCRAVLDNAAALADGLRDRGFSLATGGTETHACLVDLRPQGIEGHDAAARLAKADIICNGNQIPFDCASPRRPSGIRFGVPAVTSLGATASDMATIAAFIAEALERRDDEAGLKALGQRVRDFRTGLPQGDKAPG